MRVVVRCALLFAMALFWAGLHACSSADSSIHIDDGGGTGGLTVTPSEVTLTPGATQTFAAGEAVTWTVGEGAPGGTVTSGGFYTAPAAAGTYHVVASNGLAQTATATVHVVSSVAVGIAPGAVTLDRNGAYAFVASVTGTTNPAVTWSVQEGVGGGTVTGGGIYTAPSAAGTYHVLATSQADPSASGTATVTVVAGAGSSGEVEGILVSVTPAAVTLAPGESEPFMATVSGSNNQTVQWRVQEGAAGGSISEGGVYTAPSAAGTYHLLVTADAEPAAVATATVTVESSVAIGIAPTAVTVYTGGKVTFTPTVTGTDDKSVTWSVVEGAAGGTIANGVYTAAATAGTYHVRVVSQADTSKTATATVTVQEGSGGGGTAVGIAVAPTAVTLGPSGTQQFTATVSGTANPGVTWSVAEGGGGTVSASGLYTAPTARGTYHVVATSEADETVTARATVVVQSGSASGTVN